MEGQHHGRGTREMIGHKLISVEFRLLEGLKIFKEIVMMLTLKRSPE